MHPPHRKRWGRLQSKQDPEKEKRPVSRPFGIQSHRKAAGIEDETSLKTSKARTPKLQEAKLAFHGLMKKQSVHLDNGVLVSHEKKMSCGAAKR